MYFFCFLFYFGAPVQNTHEPLHPQIISKMAATRVRNFEALLKFKIKSPERRKNLYKNLITALVQHERIETTLCRCQDLSRVAERVSKFMFFLDGHFCVIFFALKSFSLFVMKTQNLCF